MRQHNQYPSTFNALRACLLIAAFALTGCAGVERGLQPAGHYQGEMAGEPTTNSIILQSRLTDAPPGDAKTITADDVRGRAGAACFEIAGNSWMLFPQRTDTLEATAANDFIIKTKVAGLKPAKQYHYRLVQTDATGDTVKGPLRTFRTLGGIDSTRAASFVVVTGMNYAFFHDGNGNRKAYAGPDKHLGYPALAAILNDRPDFFVGTGDNVYYDHPAKTPAQSPEQIRHKWREQFIQPRFVNLFANMATYWEKDDHDFRYNDSDLTGDRAPSPALGIAMFREQMPVVDPSDPQAVTYRTHRVNRDLQIWLLEGRDYRSPNNMEDGPTKSIWGEKQRQWLQRTLVESDAAFKIVISPTPMVGPDDGSKRDNHANPRGFRYKGEAFFAWAKANGLLNKGLYIICGDRHWQYDSIHPSGFEEFSTGALVDANARLGPKPGAPRSTDPDATIVQPYTAPQPSGGYLLVTVKPAGIFGAPRMTVDFKDEHGKLLYEVTRPTAR